MEPIQSIMLHEKENAGVEKKEKRFQIETQMTSELMKEGYRVVMNRSWGRKVLLVLALLCLGIAVCQAFEAWQGARSGWENAWGHNLPYIVYFLVLGGVLIWLLIAMPALWARRYRKQSAAVYGDGFEIKVLHTFADDAIHVESSTGQKFDTAYDQMLYVRETSHGIVMVRKQRLFEMLDKSRIAGGTLEEFRTFLQEKMPKAKFYWKA